MKNIEKQIADIHQDACLTAKQKAEKIKDLAENFKNMQALEDAGYHLDFEEDDFEDYPEDEENQTIEDLKKDDPEFFAKVRMLAKREALGQDIPTDFVRFWGSIKSAHPQMYQMLLSDIAIEIKQ